ncbi:hypothetical protein [Sutcliffiella halmapala]|uniref:hypothetical protein n=1 Tax=Sutcliffiella halmapala TaxID=79882 RepID=UPI000995CBB9|nr:hypothetical protein [Sutcliffiella halmapala]
MHELLKVAFRLFEILFFLTIGFLLTESVLKNIYDSFGIKLIGNVWVNWFGVSYILFALYVIVVGQLLKKDYVLYNLRLSSSLFWVLFIASIFTVLIPFVKGEHPF